MSIKVDKPKMTSKTKVVHVQSSLSLEIIVYLSESSFFLDEAVVAEVVMNAAQPNLAYYTVMGYAESEAIEFLRESTCNVLKLAPEIAGIIEVSASESQSPLPESMVFFGFFTKFFSFSFVGSAF